MNRESDFDQTLTDWMDEGADQAPERFVWAALDGVERTAQRGAWLASTEEFFMQLKRAAPVMGIAAAVILLIAAYQVFAAPNVGDPEPTPRAHTPEDLPHIVMTRDTVPEGWTVDYENLTTGVPALVLPLRPGGDTFDRAGFVDAFSAELGMAEGGYTSWSALFETVEDAQRGFAFLVTEHESPEGWGVDRSASPPTLGDERVMWTGSMYDMIEARTIMWREGTLLLAAVGWADWTEEDLEEIAEGMADRAK